MKKLILFLAIIACALSVSAQDSFYIYKKDGSVIYYTISTVDSISFTKPTNAPDTTNTTDTVVVINGVKWATRNVAIPGKFTTNSYDAGDFYQWNSKVGWPATGNIGSITATDGSTTWNSSWEGGYTSPSDTDWTSANDPSPAGWRVPTYAEIQTLLDATKVTSAWTMQNSVYGEKFTDKTSANSIFLPALGYRGYNTSDGTFGIAGSFGGYWCGRPNRALYFNGGGAGSDYYYLDCGFSVRPVAK
ncbi:MAG: hypothetical protein P4L28_02200 [Paludibacteraceae bacterium]|nr:hypothetical protein [Paludibacteraceae bacterium]